MISKWDKETETFEYTFINLTVKKQKVADGEFEEVVKFITGHSSKKNALWTMVEKPEAAKVAKAVETV
jgi:actin-related protein